jgi:hypothetical protein
MVNMEMKTVFEIIIGIIMMVTVTIATVAMMGGLMSMSVAECIPAEYTASNLNGKYCGLNSGGNNVYCDKITIFIPATGFKSFFDECMDASKNMCCPTTKPNITIIRGRCCNVTKI